MADGPLVARFVLGVKAPVSRWAVAAISLVAVALLSALLFQLVAWLGQRAGLFVLAVFLLLAILFKVPELVLERSFSIVLELDDTELRVYPCGRFVRARVFRLDQILHVELWQLEEQQPGISRCLHIQLADGSDALVGPWYGTDDAERLIGYFGKLFHV